MNTDYQMDLEDQSPKGDKLQYSDDEYETQFPSRLNNDEETPFQMDIDGKNQDQEEEGPLNEKINALTTELSKKLTNIDKLQDFINDEGHGRGVTTTLQNTTITGEKLLQEFAPPENFSPVVGQIYRSSFPRVENFPFLSKLKLKSILVLVPDEYPIENLDFLESQGIIFHQVGMSGNKEPFVNVPHDVITQALKIAINPENHPLLIHCNRGKHRTGCLVGCIRRLQGWSLTMILDEYRRFAAPKARPLDQQFIEMYGEDEIVELATKEGWLPIRW